MNINNLLHKSLRVLNQLYIPIIIIFIIELFKSTPKLSNLYNNLVYPYISFCLYNISNIFPFSLYDIIIVTLILFIVFCIINIFRRSRRYKYSVILVKTVLWCYISFYLFWGINYFSGTITNKNNISMNNISDDDFKSFVDEYVLNLNNSYSSSFINNDNDIYRYITPSLNNIIKDFSINTNLRVIKTKYSLFSRTYASMGIKGYYSPFSGESHISNLALDIEKPALMSHELAHLIGVTSEAEANFISYLVTTSSSNKEINYSGFFFILPYVIKDARNFLNEKEYQDFISSIKPEVINDYKNKINYWNDLYNNNIGKIQNYIYEYYLKNNNIQSGQKNYGEVIRIIINYNNNKSYI